MQRAARCRKQDGSIGLDDGMSTAAVGKGLLCCNDGRQSKAMSNEQ